MFVFFFFSCLHKPITPKEEVQIYQMHIEAELEKIDVPEEFDDVVLDITVSVRPQERFSDDSIAYSVIVEKSSVLVGGKELSSHLVGKWIRMRAFETGELLHIEYMREFSEEDPYISSFDVMWFMMFPNPPNIEMGEHKMSLARYPLLFSPVQKSRAIFQSRWELDEIKKTARLRYEGKFDLRGKWDSLEHQGKGTTKGEVHMHTSGGIPQKHTGVLERDFCYKKVHKICQKQRFNFSLEKQ